MSPQSVAKLSITILGITAAFGAEPIFTDPVGYVKLGNTTAGQDAVAAYTDVNLALPLEAESAFSGLVAATTATTITIQGSPTWTTDQWVPASGAPYTAIISSGAENGIRGLITNNSSDTLTIAVTTPGALTNVAVGDSIQIRKCWTLGTIFANAAVTDNCQILVFDETKSGVNHGSAINYLFFGGNWYNATNGLVSNDIVLHPGESFVFRSSAASIPSFTLFGDVPTASSRIDLTKDGLGAEDTEIAHPSPTPKTVGSLSIPAQDNDQLLVYDNTSNGINKGSTVNLIYAAGSWYDASTGSNVSATFKLPPGQGFVFRRSAATTSVPLEWLEPAP